MQDVLTDLGAEEIDLFLGGKVSWRNNHHRVCFITNIYTDLYYFDFDFFSIIY